MTCIEPIEIHMSSDPNAVPIDKLGLSDWGQRAPVFNSRLSRHPSSLGNSMKRQPKPFAVEIKRSRRPRFPWLRHSWRRGRVEEMGQKRQAYRKQLGRRRQLRGLPFRRFSNPTGALNRPPPKGEAMCPRMGGTPAIENHESCLVWRPRLTAPDLKGERARQRKSALGKLCQAPLQKSRGLGAERKVCRTMPPQRAPKRPANIPRQWLPCPSHRLPARCNANRSPPFAPVVAIFETRP
jgi:hypothetical protein